MIGFVIRGVSYLKVLYPVMLEMTKRGIKYNIYHYDAPMGVKEYDRVKRKALEENAFKLINKASVVRAFGNDKMLRKMLLKDRVRKIVSLEVWLFAKKYIDFFNKNKIKTYSISYLTDTLWQTDTAVIKSINRTYYSARFIMDKQLEFLKLQRNKDRDKLIGSPVFDSIVPSFNDSGILFLLPNVDRDSARSAFGGHENFYKILDKICKSKEKIIFKARKKQWVPEEVRKKGKVLFDEHPVYPTKVSEILGKTYTTVMFYSSGLYECVYGGNYVVNISLPLERWRWDMGKMRSYFQPGVENSLYNFDGVVETVSQKEALSDAWKFEPRKIDQEKRKLWLDLFVGKAIKNTSAIVDDILC